MSLPVTSEALALAALTAEGVTGRGAGTTLIWIRETFNSLIVGQYSNGGDTSRAGSRYLRSFPVGMGHAWRGSPSYSINLLSATCRRRQVG